MRFIFASFSHKKVAYVSFCLRALIIPHCFKMTSPAAFAASVSGNAKRKASDLQLKSFQSNDLTKTLHEFVRTHGNFETCAKTSDAGRLETVSEPVRNFFLLYVKQVNAINELYRCLEHLLENSKSLFDSNIIIDQVHKVSNNSISSLKMLTDSIIEKLTSSEISTDSSLVERAVKLRRYSSTDTTAVDDSKPPFEDEDMDFAGSDIELQLEEIVDNECGIKVAAQSPTCKVDRETDFRHKTLLGESEKPNDEKPYNFSYDPDGYVKVYIDGACSSNGRSNAKAGVGVWFNDRNPLNVSEPVTGSPTNNNAEIQAATKAILKANSVGIKKLRLYTDSQFVINCMTQWIFKWKQKNWINASNKPVINKISLMELDRVLPLMDAVDWKYVEGHKGILGNERADSLAKRGAQKML